MIKDRKTRVEEMAKILGHNHCYERRCDESCKVFRQKSCLGYDVAEELDKEGYRKASDVIDEFVEKITCRLNYDRDSELYDKTKISLIVNKIVEEMRQEVGSERL